MAFDRQQLRKRASFTWIEPQASSDATRRQIMRSRMIERRRRSSYVDYCAKYNEIRDLSVDF